MPTPQLLRSVRLVPVTPATTAPDAPVDVLVDGDRVLAVAPQLRAPADAEIVDADGRWLIPGLWDQHVHLGQWAAAARRLDVTDAESPEALLHLVARQVAAHPGRPVVTWGHRAGSWRAVDVAELDAVSAMTPVGLIAGDGHQAWLNTAALDAVGLPRRAGVVREAEWFGAFERFEERVSGPVTDADLRGAQLAAAARGVVGVVDFEFTGDPLGWTERAAAGAVALRVRSAVYPDGLDAIIEARLRTGDPIPGTERLVSMGALKVISDGSLNTRTAWCCQPYADHADHYGAPNLAEHELRSILGRARAAGLEAAVHAIGDRALGRALDCFADAGARGSVEHVQLAQGADLRRMARLGLRASVQPAHLLDDRDLTERLWPERTAGCFALRTMADLGIDIRLGSDAPVAPLDPWLAIGAAVHRGAPDQAPWHPEQSLSVAEALAASTDGWGTVAVGHPGDLVLLDADPLAAATLDGGAAARYLREMPVAATWVAGLRQPPPSP